MYNTEKSAKKKHESEVHFDNFFLNLLSLSKNCFRFVYKIQDAKKWVCNLSLRGHEAFCF